MKKKNHVVPVMPTLIPVVSDAVREYEALGGSLTRSSSFGIDPLESSPVLKERRQELFHSQYPQFDPVFYSCVNDKSHIFRKCVLYFIYITEYLSQY